jgi:hypothetical protein
LVGPVFCDHFEPIVWRMLLVKWAKLGLQIFV